MRWVEKALLVTFLVPVSAHTTGSSFEKKMWFAAVGEDTSVSCQSRGLDRQTPAESEQEVSWALKPQEGDAQTMHR